MTGPQDAETLQDEGSREAPANQIHIETARPLLGTLPGPRLPVAPGHPVEYVLLGDVAERLGEARLGRRPRDAALAEVLLEAVAAQPLVLKAGAGVARGEAAVVEVALLPEALQGRLDRVRLVALAQERTPQLARRVVAARQLLQGALVGRLA
ncbi:MAG TPA: hypothetical protein VFM88_06305 [Vicinamibacteria bacterium]|nr:hypothetical protein [Vicinamibacteria bacterium]